MKSCIGNLKRDCSGNCEDYLACLNKSLGVDIKSEIKEVAVL